MSEKSSLKILHVLRAPLGGLFRHVVDLVCGQAARGHQVGIVADATTGGVRADQTFAKLKDQLDLGLTRIPISRQLSFGDFASIRHVGERITAAAPDVVHGHGAKGAAYARLAARGFPAIRTYTPHGGSLLYKPGTLGSRFYVTLETVMRPYTDLFLFESAYSAQLYRQKVGEPKGIVRVVHNGIGPEDFEQIAPGPDATDIVFVGELRSVKGVDVLIEAIAALHAQGMKLGAAIVGDGPDRISLQEHARRLNLEPFVRFHGPLPARQAFRLGRLMVVPSRAESLPYIVLEAAGAGLPLITTNVGGVSEIFGPMADRLIPAEDKVRLTQAIAFAVNNLQQMQHDAAALRTRVQQSFSVDGMVDGVLEGYRAALAQKP